MLQKGKIPLVRSTVGLVPFVCEFTFVFMFVFINRLFFTAIDVTSFFTVAQDYPIKVSAEVITLQESKNLKNDKSMPTNQ